VTDRDFWRQARRDWGARARTARTAVALIWSASPVLVCGLALMSLAIGLLAPATAWLQRDVLDALTASGGRPPDPRIC